MQILPLSLRQMWIARNVESHERVKNKGSDGSDKSQILTMSSWLRVPIAANYPMHILRYLWKAQVCNEGEVETAYLEKGVASFSSSIVADSDDEKTPYTTPNAPISTLTTTAIKSKSIVAADSRPDGTLYS